MNNYINNIENSMIKIEVDYECSVHGKGKVIIKKLKSKPTKFNVNDWQNWQYPKQDELCPDCRQEKIKERCENERQKSMKEWFYTKTPQQQQEIRNYQTNLEAEKEYEKKLRCQQGYVTSAQLIDFKKLKAGDN